MNERTKRIAEAIEKSGYSYAELAAATGISKSSLQRYATGETTKIPVDAIERIAAATHTDSGYLLAWAPPAEPSNIAAVYEDHIRMVPVYESVSAGFGALAENSVVEYLPLRIVSDYEAAETICIRVEGDSMFPKIENGDIIQVHKQESVDSGDIAVVLLDGDEGLVKKVLYGADWIELHSINPMYPVQRFEKEDVLRLRVVGKVKGVFKAL